MSKFNNINLTKKIISKKINLKTGLPTSYTCVITDDLIGILKELIKLKDLNIKNFATFKVIKKSKRIGRNPKNKQVFKITARKSLSFIASKSLNNKVKDL